MVHLIGFTRLGQCIGFVDQQDDAAACGTLGRLELAGLIERMFERSRNELGHLANPALAA
ncbi:hypothetical protein D9M72_588730 [compost metagenome]